MHIVSDDTHEVNNSVNFPARGFYPPSPSAGSPDTPLGINAIFVSQFDDTARGEWQKRIYKLQYSASKLLRLNRDRQLAALGEYVGSPNTKRGYHRVNFCHWVKWADQVDVRYSSEYKRAAYRGLVTCGSWSACPVCGSRISQHRAGELGRMVAGVRALGHITALASLTIPHKQGDNLYSLLEDLRQPFRRMKGGARGAWAKLVERYGVGVEGKRRLFMVTGFENTWGYNGHHPHLHPLLVLRAGSDVLAFEHELRDIWYRATGGLDGVLDESTGELTAGPRDADKWEHGCTVTSNDGAVAEYITKWNKPPRWDVAQELAKSNIKRGRGSRSKHYTMMELLWSYSETGNPVHGAAWVEFALAVKGNHQLQWSPGLRDWLGMGVEASDEEVAHDLSAYEQSLIALDGPTWVLVRQSGKRGELLALGASGERQELLDFIGLLWLAQWIRGMGDNGEEEQNEDQRYRSPAQVESESIGHSP